MSHLSAVPPLPGPTFRPCLRCGDQGWTIIFVRGEWIEIPCPACQAATLAP